MKRRNISIFFDGTGQCCNYQPKYHWTNVAFLYDAVDTSEQPDVIQTRKYLDGVGTREGEELSGGGFGIGLDERIQEACDFLYQEFDLAVKHSEEPHIYLFGFSRGAFAARWLASLLELCGVSKGHPSPRKLFSIHENNDLKGARKNIEEKSVFHPVNVDFLGVWDTVEASIDKVKGLEQLPSCVDEAYHALAIDEWRRPFKPTHFAPARNVVEVWFPGCHTDVGGGYEVRKLADAPLWWIVSGCRKHKLRIDEEALRANIEEVENGAVFHDELATSILWKALNVKSGIIGKYFREIGTGEHVDETVEKYAYSAPKDRQTIPSGCEIVNVNSFNGGNCSSC